jgi:hypothetical protein
MTLTIGEQRILITLAVLLQAGHVESARLIIAEALDKKLEDPGIEPLSALDDAAFKAFSETIRAEALRRRIRVGGKSPGEKR